jgi:hypothetical protein
MRKLRKTMKTVFHGRYFLEKTVNRKILDKKYQPEAINVRLFASMLLAVAFIGRIISVSLTGYPTI